MGTSLTLSFIGKYLKASGLDVKRDGNAYYTNLAQNKDLLVGLKKGKLSVAVALPLNEEDSEIVSMLADITMASTVMTKVFLVPEEDGMKIWFAVETFCKTRCQFEEILDPTFKLLLESVRTYIKIKEDIEEAVRTEVVVTFLMEQKANKQPN